MSIKLSDLSPKYQQQAAQKYFSASKSRQNRTREPQDRGEGRGKYKNIPDERNVKDGQKIRFDSRREAAHFDELMIRLRAGEIRNLKLQPEFTLQEAYTTPDGQRVRAVKYRADFSYETPCGDPNGLWITVVEDVKGMQTDVYKLKKKLMRERFNVDIVEV